MSYQVVDGVAEISCRSGQDFLYQIQHLPDLAYYRFHGETLSSKPLMPRFYESITRQNSKQQPVVLHALLEKFKSRLPFEPSDLRTCDNQYWGLGYLYELVTPLLAWDESPFLACQKSLSPFANQEQDAYVYALDVVSVQYKFTRVFIDRLESIMTEGQWQALQQCYHDVQQVDAAQSFMDFCYQAVLKNSFSQLGIPSQIRALVQQAYQQACQTECEIFEPRDQFVQYGMKPSTVSCFSKTCFDMPLEQWVSNNYKGSEKCILIKYIIPTSDRVALLKALTLMNGQPVSGAHNLQAVTSHLNHQCYLDGIDH